MLSVLIRDRVIAAPIPDLRPSRGPRVASDTGLASIAENGYEDQTSPRKRKKSAAEGVQDDRLRQFIAGAPARTGADLARVNRRTTMLFFHKARALIASGLADTDPWLSGEIRVDESCFIGPREGKHSRGASGF